MAFGIRIGNSFWGKWTISDTLRSLSGIPTSSQLIINDGLPVWRDLSTMKYLLDCYQENPVVQAIINIKAEAFANIKFSVKDLKSGEILPLEEYTSDKGKLQSLLSSPNPLQSTYEWLRQHKVNREVFGNGYVHASVPIGYEKGRFTYRDINVMNNLPPYCVTPVLTGKWLSATEKSEIIKEYRLEKQNGKHESLPVSTVMHTNNVNILHNENFTQGASELVALAAPITNIDKAFESRNVLIRKRGALGAWTSDKKDEAMGSVPLRDEEKEQVQEDFKKYGLLDDQWQQIITSHPLKWQSTAMKVKDLMLFEEIEADAIAISNSFGVPELLAKYYLKGSTFNNLDASEKRLYDSTIIPESKDFMVALNNFLNTKEHGIELLGTYDHLNILQENKKEEAETRRTNQETALAAFRIGAITYNDYLNAIGLPNNPKIGEKHIWELEENMLRAIGVLKSEISKEEAEKNALKKLLN
ncbi:phage portal protein [Muricauda sp. CAU 1633]|uniref:phage portal protein n=1 Tax=Allomuricauda sp. CAU 1633 TaxID=2816036 RepID=UPI001A90B2FB|nr:phage portal protein [Muricauda sp. CAU 1633]MBO0323469.1 phage portal protein [Muricauda sp. CAU 1633]